jgi:hypothetical protein
MRTATASPSPGPRAPTARATPWDSQHVLWHRRAGLFLATRYLRRHRVPVVEAPLAELPRLSRATIRLALRLFPRFLDRADLTFPIIVAGRGAYQIALDGRHRISKAIWTGVQHLPTVRVPLGYAAEILIPGVYEVEWLYLFLRAEARPAGIGPPRSSRDRRGEDGIRAAGRLRDQPVGAGGGGGGGAGAVGGGGG